MLRSIPNWRQALHKRKKAESSTRKWDQQYYIPTIDEIKQMKASLHAQSCQRYLGRKPETLEEAIDARDYIMFQITCQNANRAGLLSNMTITDLKSSKKVQERRVVHIASHKTLTTYGGALVNLTEELYSNIWRYIRGSRERLLGASPAQTTDNVFISMNGFPLKSNSVNQAMKRFAEKTLVLSEEKTKRFCNTMVRKATVTNTRDKDSNQQGDLASLMLHSVRVANSNYDLPDKIQKSASGHEIVTQLYATPEKATPASDTVIEPMFLTPLNKEGEEEEEEQDTPLNNESEEEEEQDTPLNKEGEEEKEQDCESETNPSTNIVPPSVDSRSTPQRVQSIVHKSRTRWSDTDTEIIKEEARAIISGQISATRINIHATIEKKKRLRKLAKEQGKERLFEKIKSLKKSAKNV